MNTQDTALPAIHFCPQLFITPYSLRNLPVRDIIAEVKGLKEKLRDIFPHVIGQCNLYIKDLFGNIYQFVLTMNYHYEDGERIEHEEVIVAIWSPDGMRISHDCFKLDKEGKLSDVSIMNIKRVMEEYSKGTFRCSKCGKTGRRFADGVGRTPTSHVCAECYAKPEVRTAIQRAFNDMSR